MTIAQLPFTVAAAAEVDPCLKSLPQATQRTLGNRLEAWQRADLALLIDEYAYRQNWLTHADAMNGGFSLGDRVYGQELVLDGVFDRQAVVRWKASYERDRRQAYLKSPAGRADERGVSRDVIRALSGSCLSQGLWASIRPLDQCRFVFRAGFRATEPAPSRAGPFRLAVTGASCEPWPTRLLGGEGATTTCVRNGVGRVTISLTAAQAGTISRDLAPLKSVPVPDEPMQFERTSKPLIENVTVYRARDYRIVERGRGCPQCRDLYAADFAPTTPGAVIREVGFVSGFAGGDWQRCPAGWTCGAPEFSPPDNRNRTGCAGASSCRIWRLAGDDKDARDTIQIVYHVKEQACSNCPEGVDYEEAHRRWELAKGAQQHACGAFSPTTPERTPPGSHP